MECQLDNEIFTCCKCKGEFDVTQGTWLPIGIEDKSEPIIEGEYPKVIEYGNFLRPPEIITSDDFTCYECGG